MTCYLIDLDGTLLVDSHEVNGAADFIEELIGRKQEFLLITNGSVNSPEKLSHMLFREGINIPEFRIITTAEVSAAYMEHHYADKSVCCIGSEWLQQCLRNRNISLQCKNAEIVLTGYDDSVSMEMLNHAIELIENGAEFISTNNDVWIPSKNGIRPHTGCLNEIVKLATGKDPVIIGKPNEFFWKMIKEKTSAEKFCIIGDSIKTDMMFGINSKITVFLVESNITEKDSLQNQADIKKVKSLLEIAACIV